MARTFGLKVYRVNLALANTPQSIFTTTQQNAGHARFTEFFRVTSLAANTGVFALGDSSVTVNTGNATDGAVIDPSGFEEYGVSPKMAAIPSEFDLSNISIVGTVAGDDFFVTYISKES
jgi:hypothetical protein